VKIHLTQLTLGNDISGTRLTGKTIEKALWGDYDTRSGGSRFRRLGRSRLVEVEETGNHGDEH
jgi:hypothetical protein